MKINRDIKIQGISVWEDSKGPVPELKSLCRKIAAEGTVLLKNESVLPFSKGTKVALFGRTQEYYIRSGTGSGGCVIPETMPCIWDSFKDDEIFTIDEELVDLYKSWIAENPLDNGHGWATEPWCQNEMPITFDLASKMAKQNDVAVVILGRTAGEDKDNSDVEGSYQLNAVELEMLENVTKAFQKTVVVLNVGNLIDLSFMDKSNVSALLYVWQGGEEGANALADILSGRVSPSGKLPDTQVYSAKEYPSLSDFGNEDKLVYTEDIYVGYRYFETFRPQAVRYPFGFGLTYTNFDISYSVNEQKGKIIVQASVKNVGNFPSKEVVQVYYGAPCGKLGNPSRQLIAFKKTKELKSGECEELELSFDIKDTASYDDSGVTGNKFCYVLEQGEYKVYVGTDVRSAKEVFAYNIPNTVAVKTLEQALAPNEPFERIVAKEHNGKRVIEYEKAPLTEYSLEERIKERREKDVEYTGDKGIQLVDVAQGKNTMDEFVAQMSDDDLCAIVCGEGMNSPKVTPGTGGAFGGVTDSLLSLGIPVCCVSDGPSGIRIGNDYKTTLLPNGYVFASSFNTELTERIFEIEGIELFRYDIDALLGPGMNIHRHPLCGRNFEYFSEDPLLSGKIAAAQTRGVKKSGCTTTIKHFCGNNQERARTSFNAVISERALREIYLKGFEIAVKEGGATSVMTAYNLVNGYHTASNYDLTTTILRKEWGYNGFVMTDWWAKCNANGEAGSRERLKAMVRAQNDVYMVCNIAADKPHDIKEGLKDGYIVRSDLQRCAKNLLRYIIDSPTFAKFVDGGCKKPIYLNRKPEDIVVIKTIENPTPNDVIECEFGGEVIYSFDLVVNAEPLSQYKGTLYIDDSKVEIIVSGTNGKKIQIMRSNSVEEKTHKVSFDFPSVIEIKKLNIGK